MLEESRIGKFGSAKPAFSCHRFKRTITLNLNEEMAEELFQLLEANEEAVEGNGGTVAPYFNELANQLVDAIDQKPPAVGQKPEVLAPGRRRKVA